MHNSAAQGPKGTGGTRHGETLAYSKRRDSLGWNKLTERLAMGLMSWSSSRDSDDGSHFCLERRSISIWLCFRECIVFCCWCALSSIFCCLVYAVLFYNGIIHYSVGFPLFFFSEVLNLIFVCVCIWMDDFQVFKRYT